MNYVSVFTSDGLLAPSFLENVLQVELAGFVAGSDQRPAGAVEEAHFVGFRLPKSELLRRHVLLHLQVPLRRLEREKGWGGEMGVTMVLDLIIPPLPICRTRVENGSSNKADRHKSRVRNSISHCQSLRLFYLYNAQKCTKSKA